ncbi:MAG: motility protein A [Planctomycetota bacterium]|jgi:chemotaxis protein MotA
MDLATLIGLIMGVLLLAAAMFSRESLNTFVDWPSVAIVLGGTGAALLISFPLKKVLNLIRVTKNAFFSETQSAQQLITDLVKYAEIARRDGILSLESMTETIQDRFIVKGIQMAVDGTDPELIEQILEGELDSLSDRHGQGRQLFETMGKYAPAFGMIGTLIGLVIMLKNMEDTSQIGAGMAVALITTLYGAISANLVFLPIADKLRMRSSEEMLMKQIIIKGVMSIQSGDNPRIVEQKLKTFLPPSFRDFEEAKE